MTEGDQEVDMDLSRAFVNNASSTGNLLIQRSQGEMDANEQLIRARTKTVERGNWNYDWKGRGVCLSIGAILPIIFAFFWILKSCATA